MDGSFARVLVFDRRRVGLSDPVAGAPTLEERMDDVRAVMDAAGSERAALLGMSEGATMCMLFAATYPERTSALVLWGAMPRSTAAPDYPWAPDREAVTEAQEELIGPMWGQGATIEEFLTGVRPGPAPERVLFTDIVDSTRLATELGDRRWRELIGEDVGGIAVHVAARIAALAGPQEVLASRTVRDLAAGSAVDFQPAGRHALKGVPDEWDVYSVG